jgi:uncharacterized membrane protein YgdD (TMEM256/DUF423 family)
MYKPALIAGILFAGFAVVIGAFGAHYLKSILSTEQLVSFETGVRYQFYHSFALLITGILAHFTTSKMKLITAFFSIGIILFSGSIYMLTVLKATSSIGLGAIGILTPIGGLCFIVAWSLLLFKAILISTIKN